MVRFFIAVFAVLIMVHNSAFCSERIICEATAYSLDGCEKAPTDYGYGITASGEYVRRGIIATDTDVIPMHSLVLVLGGGVDGLYEAKDIGGAVVGNKIDIYMPDTKDCIKFGRRKVKVIILRRGKYMFKEFTKGAIMPMRSTEHSAGYDFFSNEDCVIPPHKHILVHSGISVELECDEVMLLIARSSLHKKGLMLINGVGVIDADYRGEIMMPLYNITDEPVIIEQGDKLTQGVIVTYRTFGDIVDCQRDGGFGSTGN